jgi:hypothetical protein
MTRSRSAFSPTSIVVCIACCLVLVVAARPTAADRDADVITPDGSPIWLDPLRALFFDSPGVLVMVQNRHSQPVASALRIWIVDARFRLKASVDYCAIEQLGRNTRGSVFVPLEVPGITLRDRVVVTVAAAGSGRAVWRTRQGDADQLAAVRAAAQGWAARLSFERDDNAQDAWSCPCEPPAIEASCTERCADSGVAASEATRLLNVGCLASCTCR